MTAPSPEFVIHRVNERSRLRHIPRHCGVEIDLRADGSAIVLNHEPFRGGEPFDDWLTDYEHGLLVLNIKEAGIESDVIRRVEARGVKRFFLLDVEFPYIYRAARRGERRMAMRYSEDEAIETVIKYRGLVDWVWIDTNTRLPLGPRVVRELAGFRTCLVCPERWGRPEDIPAYLKAMRRLHFTPSAVMTSEPCMPAWVKAYAGFQTSGST